jgi:hypothetical protein
MNSSLDTLVDLLEISACMLCHHLNINVCGQMINPPLPMARPMVIRKPYELLIEA